MAIKFSEVAASVVHALMDFLGDSNNPSALDVVAFVREVVEKFPFLRPTITEKLTATLGSIKSGKVFRGVLWILGEYVEGVNDIERAMVEVRGVLGEIPILAAEIREAEGNGAVEGGEEEGASTGQSGGRPRVLADGTYATETAYTSSAPVHSEASKAKPPLRGGLFDPLKWAVIADTVPSADPGGDFFTGSVLAAALTKFVLRYDEQTSERASANALRAEVTISFLSSGHATE
jgi:coatomer subunit beta